MTASVAAGLLPLSGLRIADFSWVIAGPFCTEHLALMGAEVIKIESSVHTDLSRRLPPYAGGVPGIERSGHFGSYARGKKSVTLNLGNPLAQELALELIRHCDVVIENFSYGQMEKFKLGYDRLREANPRLIYVHSSGLGRSGPYQRYVTWGPPLLAYAGIASVTGQDGGQPERGIGGVWADHLSGLTSLFGMLAALEGRERTGEGRSVEYSMAEAVSAQIPEAIVEYGCTGVPPGPRGNRDRGMCPHGVFPVLGKDRWIAIVVRTDAEWRRFRELVPGPEWWSSPQLDTVTERLAREAEVNAVVSAWTERRSGAALAVLLRAAGVPAGPVATLEEVVNDPILHERGFFVEEEHPEVGYHLVAGAGWQVDALPAPEARPPLLGEHNWEVFVEWLGMAPERFAELVREGAIV